MVFHTAWSILGNVADAEDVLQTLFLRLIRREFPPEFRSNVRGYFYRSAVNLSLDTIRARKRIELIGEPDQFESAFDDSEGRRIEQIHRRLTEAIAELPADAAHILILRYVHNHSDAEIAKLLGTSRTVIAVRLFRARARLKKRLLDPGEDQ
jgi:RNA polymerase sigma-70 factor (ECF subfamily)